MRLVIDMLGAQGASRSRGIGRYALGFTRALIAQAGGHEVILAACEDVDGENPDSLKGSALIGADFPALAAMGRVVGYRTMRSVSYERPENDWRRRAGALARDAAFAALEPDAVLSLSMFEGYREDALTSSLDLARPAVRAVVAYDVIPLIFSDDYLRHPGPEAWYRDKLAAFARQDLFLAISGTTADDLVSHLSIEPARIAMISAGADAFDSADVASSRDVADRFGLGGGYFIYAASWEERKNFPALIDAFGRFKRAAGATSAQTLVLVTQNSPPVLTAIDQARRQAGLAERDVVATGHVDDATLRRLYRDARALVYPSLYEGFGLPILEAMICDTPVVCSATSSMREIMDFDEGTFDPRNPQAIAEAMARAADDEAFRTRLLANGRARRKAFSWDDSARRAWAALDEATRARDARPRRRERWARHAELTRELRAIPDEKVAPTNSDLAALSDVVAANLDLYDACPRFPAGPMAWRVEGPVDSSYSLALVNRETIRALKRQGVETHVVSSEGPGDYAPDLAYLADGHSDVAALLRTDRDAPLDRLIVASRDMYPPRVADMSGDLNMLHHYAWEESRFPGAWVDDFNLYLDGATCLSDHTKKALQDSGVAIPLVSSGCGVDHWLAFQAEEGLVWPGKSFRFLHVSSCFPRKGADALVAAFGRAFRSGDDVSLIIKTFSNPHNDIAERLEAARAADPDYPDVHLIFEDLAPARLKSLYQHCHALVAPSRAEGFGLPIAEALLSGLPPIVTGWSGQLDFCRPQWCWLVDFRFAPADTHFRLAGSVWADPDVDDLAAKMREAALTSAERRAEMAAAGRAFLLRNNTWDGVVTRLRTAAERLPSFKRPKPARLGWVTTWGCACGVATYSAHLIDRIAQEVVVFGAHDDDPIAADGPNVRRSWRKHAQDDDLTELEDAVRESGVEALVIQFNYGFFRFERLSGFIERMTRAGVPIFIVLHATVDPPTPADKRLALLAPALRLCARVICHSHHDLNRLKAIGIVGEACLVPHGVVAGQPPAFRPHSERIFVLGSYGFCLPHKGLLALVDAFGQLAQTDDALRLDLVNAEYPIDLSRALVAEIGARIVALGIQDRVAFTSDFLSDRDSMEKLAACDLLVFAYEDTGESASGAARFGLASGRPVATTRLPIFADVEPAVFQFEAGDATILARELGHLIERLRRQGEDIDAKMRESARWRQDHSYDRIAAQLTGLVQATLVERAFASPS